ncbi:circularly permuted type 2 ATP-grasp protein [Litorimonas sp. RW-G-Af-16]|uniref:circularly permuted type 2 ATP-grasp protein n=1 Tax=Litorimonas sp. RW-G-Af-16 TaxID=3241168 RepID=UPI003AADFCC9
MEFFDEMLAGDQPRESYQSYHDWFSSQDTKLLKRKMIEAEAVFRRTGITFNVYGKKDADERLIPFDIIPRIIAAREWQHLTRGIEQRVRAINAFLHDIYHGQEILKAGIIPSALIENNDAYLPQMIGVTPPGKVYTHIVGVDLVRTGADDFFVLEDNARTPSGVSYMLENRETMLQIFPELFSKNKVQRVNNYPQMLRQSLEACAPPKCDGKPVIAVLTPGIHNSAYFEHAFLADQMGAELVESHDLRVRKGKVCMRTTQGYTPIDVIYRRVDDDYLDPLNFKPESMLGIAGVMDIYRAGGITIANAPGAGIADDKAIYSYMPDIVRFYTGEKALLRNIETWRCSDADSLKYVLEHLPELVVKEVHGSGGYGMLVGPASTKAEIERFRKKLINDPDNYIAQPTLALSTTPILEKGGLSPRHVDLRPFVLVGSNEIMTTPGGLTRVAMKKGSLVVNSSQGGGTKDTWVLED